MKNSLIELAMCPISQRAPTLSIETIGNTQMMAKGLYFLRLVWEDGVGVSKVVVNK